MDYRSISADELARICADSGNVEAWKEFVRRFQRPLALMVMRTARSWGGFSSTTIDDLVQETYLRLCVNQCRLLRNFVPRHPDSIVGYLQVIAANTVHDYFRGKKSLKRGGALSEVDIEASNPETLAASSASPERIEHDVQIAEIRRALESVPLSDLPDRDRTIFWLYFQQGFTAQAIANIGSFRLNVKGVESSIHRTVGLARTLLDPRDEKEISLLREGISRFTPISKEEA